MAHQRMVRGRERHTRQRRKQEHSEHELVRSRGLWIRALEVLVEQDFSSNQAQCRHQVRVYISGFIVQVCPAYDAICDRAGGRTMAAENVLVLEPGGNLINTEQGPSVLRTGRRFAMGSSASLAKQGLLLNFNGPWFRGDVSKPGEGRD